MSRRRRLAGRPRAAARGDPALPGGLGGAGVAGGRSRSTSCRGRCGSPRPSARAGRALPSLLFTLAVTGEALLAAVVLGGGLAVLLAQSRWIERSFFPLAVVLQVTPIVAIAPLLLIWVKDVRLALVLCAGIVAFFPIVANTTLGLNSADHHLLDLLRLYGASRWQVFRRVRLPAALPYFLRRPADQRRPRRSSEPWSRSSSPAAAAPPPASPGASWRRAIPCRFPACSRRWPCSRRRES